MLEQIFPDALFNYLKTRPLVKKLLDMFLISLIGTWLAFLYVVATNWPAIQTIVDNYGRVEHVEVAAAVVMNQRVSSELERLLNRTGADRVYVSKFHNGRKDLQGIHFVYASIINEVNSPGVSSIIQRRQGILLSIINEWMVRFIANNCAIYTNVPKSSPFYEFFAEQGMKSAIMCPVTASGGTPVGFIGVDYTTQSVSSEQLWAKIANVRETAARVSGYFNPSEK
jgi:hypothetical protein